MLTSYLSNIHVAELLGRVWSSEEETVTVYRYVTSVRHKHFRPAGLYRPVPRRAQVHTFNCGCHGVRIKKWLIVVENKFNKCS